MMLEEAVADNRGGFSPSWPEEQVDLLKKLWDEGLTAGAIGDRIGRTRSAILGLIHRKGWQRRSVTPRIIHLRQVGILKRGPKPRPRPTVADRVKLPIAARAPIIPEPPALFKTIVALRDDECHFSVSQESPHFFCGQPTADRSSYCPHHRAVTTRIVSLEGA